METIALLLCMRTTAMLSLQQKELNFAMKHIDIKKILHFENQTNVSAGLSTWVCVYDRF